MRRGGGEARRRELERLMAEAVVFDAAILGSAFARRLLAFQSTFIYFVNKSEQPRCCHFFGPRGATADVSSLAPRRELLNLRRGPTE